MVFAVAFVERRQHESISRSISPRDALRRTLAGEGDAPAQTDGPNPTADGPRRCWIALERSNAAEAPIEIANPGQRLDKKLVAFARDEVGHTEQRSHGRAPRPGWTGRLCRAGWDNRDPFRGDAIALDSSGRSTARTEDAANLREQPGLELGGPLRRGRR